MDAMRMAEVYAGKAVGEPTRTICGTDSRLIEKAAALARELGQPVEVVIEGDVQVYRVTAQGRVGVVPR